jgi:hypothetical protein
MRDGRTRLFMSKSVDTPAPEQSTPCAGEAGIIGGEMLLALAHEAESRPRVEEPADALQADAL